MTTRLNIEDRVEADVSTVLASYGVSNLHRMYAERTGSSEAVGVWCASIGDTFFGVNLPSGFVRASIVIDCSTDLHDDPDGSALRAMARTVREAWLRSDMVDTLNAMTSFATYYGYERGIEITPSPEDRRRHIEINGTLIMRPSDNSTTTSTSSTSTVTTTSTTTT